MEKMKRNSKENIKKLEDQFKRHMTPITGVAEGEEMEGRRF